MRYQLPKVTLPLLAALALVLGGAFYATMGARPAQTIWTAGLLVAGLPVVSRTARGALAGRFAADLVAALAIIGALLLDQPLAGLVVVLMQTGGEALERYADGRASRAVRDLEAAAPRIAHRVMGITSVDIPVAYICPGDVLLVRPGEMLPSDSEVIEGRSDVDTSRLTGEPLPRAAAPGMRLPSGSVNGNAPLTVRATATASTSQYELIVQLVRSAEASKSPLQRLADRYAVWFTPLTLAVCLLAWVASHDPTRVLAVLVVATPCPLILATPVAVVGGINRAARRQILFRHGSALEQLGHVTAGVFDKTGTLTVGQPQVARVEVVGGYSADDLLRLAASVESASGHLLARTVVSTGLARQLAMSPPTAVVEWPGQGVEGVVDGRTVTVGGWSFIANRHPRAEADLASLRERGHGLRAWVVIDGRGAGAIVYADALRPGLPEFFVTLRHMGIQRLVLLSGDSQENAEQVAQRAGLDEVRGDLLPADKVAHIQALLQRGERVLMVGDGANDAPALATATVGVALAQHGGGISAEAADVVLLADDPTRIADAIGISRATIRIARQSIWVGLGLSGIAMGFAAFGYIAPVAGAILQEVIDVGVIVNALRAART